MNAAPSNSTTADVANDDDLAGHHSTLPDQEPELDQDFDNDDDEEDDQEYLDDIRDLGLEDADWDLARGGELCRTFSVKVFV